MTTIKFEFEGKEYTVDIKVVLEAIFNFVGAILAKFAPEVNDGFKDVANKL